MSDFAIIDNHNDRLLRWTRYGDVRETFDVFTNDEYDEDSGDYVNAVLGLVSEPWEHPNEGVKWFGYDAPYYFEWSVYRSNGRVAVVSDGADTTDLNAALAHIYGDFPSPRGIEGNYRIVEVHIFDGEEG